MACLQISSHSLPLFVIEAKNTAQDYMMDTNMRDKTGHHHPIIELFVPFGFLFP